VEEDTQDEAVGQSDANEPELDEWGDPIEASEPEVEAPIEAESESVDEEIVAAAPAAQHSTHSAPYVPPPVTRYEMTPEERTAFAERILTDPTAILDEIDRRVESRLLESQVLNAGTDAQVNALAAKYPSLYAQYGPQMRAALAAAPAGVKQTQRQAEWAVINAMSNEIGKTGGLDEIVKFGKLIEKDTSGTTAPRQTTAPIPPSRKAPASKPLPPAARMPSPSATGNTRRQVAAPDDSDGMALMFSMNGISKAHAKAVANEVRTNRGRW